MLDSLPPYTSGYGGLSLTKLPVVRYHVVNHNTYPGQNTSIIYQQKREHRNNFYFYILTMSACLSIELLLTYVSLYKYTTNYHQMENNI